MQIFTFHQQIGFVYQASRFKALGLLGGFLHPHFRVWLWNYPEPACWREERACSALWRQRSFQGGVLLVSERFLRPESWWKYFWVARNINCRDTECDYGWRIKDSVFYLLRLKIKHLFALGGKKGHVHRLEFVVDGVFSLLLMSCLWDELCAQLRILKRAHVLS